MDKSNWMPPHLMPSAGICLCLISYSRQQAHMSPIDCFRKQNKIWSENLKPERIEANKQKLGKQTGKHREEKWNVSIDAFEWKQDKRNCFFFLFH